MNNIDFDPDKDKVSVNPLMDFSKQIADATQNTAPDAPQKISEQLKSQYPNMPDEQIVQRVQFGAARQALAGDNDPTKQSLYNSIAQYGQEQRAAKQQEYEAKAKDIDTSKNWSGLAARSLDSLDQIEGRYDKQKAEAKENIVGSFDKQQKLAFDQLTTGMDVEIKKQAIEKGQYEVNQFKSAMADSAQNADPNSPVSQLKRATLQKYAPGVAQQLGDSFNNISGAQIDKQMPGFEKAWEREEKSHQFQIQMATIKQTADDNRASREQVAREGFATRRDIAGMMSAGRRDAAAEKQGEGEKTYAREEAKGAAKFIQTAPETLNSIDSKLDDVRELKNIITQGEVNTGKLGGPIGTVKKWIPIPGVGAADERFEAISARMELASAADMLHGQGAISDGERRIVKGFQPSRDKTEEANLAGLNEVEEILARGRRNVERQLTESQKLGKKYGGTVGVSTPAPTATDTTSKRKWGF